VSIVTVTAIEGNRQQLDGGAMFGNAPRSVWSQWLQPDDKNRITLNCRAMLLEIDGKKILCETGIGAFFEPKLADRYGVSETTHKLLENLAAVGISESDIDFVILSHLHFDHAGGLLPSWNDQQKGRTDLLFPKAQYVVGKVAFERATNPHPRDRASFIPGMTDKLIASARLILVDEETHRDVLPHAISFVFTDGHTPGQMHTVATSVSANDPTNTQNRPVRKVVFAGDLIPGRYWVHLPITMGYDRFPERVIDEKKRFYEQFGHEDVWVFYTHDHEVAMSHIKSDEKGRFVAYNDVASPKAFPL
jgi:glyoxylase-like metal-dependent hydrolase (beta-lactamase superfamily II)